MRFLFVNQYGPPDSPPTARLVGEAAEFLRQKGHEVKVICQRQDYRGRPARGLRRLWREWWALATMAWTGLRVQRPAPQVVLAWSSPPGVLVVAALLARWHQAQLAHWAMDLYPELAIALGEIGPSNPVASAVRSAMNWAYHRASLVVALDEDMRAHLQPFCRCQVRVLEPWPSAAALAAGSSSDAGHCDTPWTWLYSGNLGRAHEWQTLLDAQRLLEDRGVPVRLVFQGDGAARAAAQSYAKQLTLHACEWTGYVSEGDLVPTLLGARVLIVTQRPETCGLLWPSKLALLERLPRPILFVGPREGAIAKRLQEHGQAGVFAPGESEAVARWIEDVFHGWAAWDARPTRSLPTGDEQLGRLQQWLLELGMPFAAECDLPP